MIHSQSYVLDLTFSPHSQGHPSFPRAGKATVRMTCQRSKNLTGEALSYPGRFSHLPPSPRQTGSPEGSGDLSHIRSSPLFHTLRKSNPNCPQGSGESHSLPSSEFCLHLKQLTLCLHSPSHSPVGALGHANPNMKLIIGKTVWTS